MMMMMMVATRERLFSVQHHIMIFRVSLYKNMCYFSIVYIDYYYSISILNSFLVLYFQFYFDFSLFYSFYYVLLLFFLFFGCCFF